MGKKVKIAAIALRAGALGPMKQEALAAHALSLVDQLTNVHPDLICLPEEVLIATGDRNNENWEANNRDFLAALRARAAKMRALIEVCLEEPSKKYPGKRYNTAYLIGRAGEILGAYRKNHVTYRALEGDGLPGERLPVFDTDIGRIGIQTCFDIGWRKPWAALSDRGCNLVIWNAAYDGGNLLNTYAAHNMYFVASSVWTSHAKLIDLTGRTITESSVWDGFAVADVNLDTELFHIDRQLDRLETLRRALGDKIEIRTYSEENVFTLAVNDPEWDMARLKREFGLQSYKDYHAEYDRLNDECLKEFPEDEE